MISAAVPFRLLLAAHSEDGSSLLTRDAAWPARPAVGDLVAVSPDEDVTARVVRAEWSWDGALTVTLEPVDLSARELEELTAVGWTAACTDLASVM